jgi:hypothetical protein
VDTEAAFLDNLRGDVEVILSDYTMPEFDGLRAQINFYFMPYM